MALTGSWGREGTGVIRIFEAACMVISIRLKMSKKQYLFMGFFRTLKNASTFALKRKCVLIQTLWRFPLNVSAFFQVF
jgi:hypothetical protein